MKQTLLFFTLISIFNVAFAMNNSNEAPASPTPLRKKPFCTPGFRNIKKGVQERKHTSDERNNQLFKKTSSEKQGSK